MELKKRNRAGLGGFVQRRSRWDTLATSGSKDSSRWLKLTVHAQWNILVTVRDIASNMWLGRPRRGLDKSLARHVVLARTSWDRRSLV